ncbi:unnamed protein product, partial [marine sediment metagenome]
MNANINVNAVNGPATDPSTAGSLTGNLAVEKLFAEINGRKDCLSAPLRYVIDSWQELLVNHWKDIKNYNLADLSGKMTGIATAFFDRHASGDAGIEIDWDGIYVSAYYSVFIKSEKGPTFLFPFDLIRYSTFQGFVERLVQELVFCLDFPAAGDLPLPLSRLVDKIPAIANECSPGLSKIELQVVEATITSSPGLTGIKDKALLLETPKSIRRIRSIKQKLTSLGIINEGTRINYPVLGLIPYVVYHARKRPVPWKDFTYLEIDCSRDMRVTVVFIPEQKTSEALVLLNRLGTVSPLVKGGSCYNFSLFNSGTGSWDIDIKKIFTASKGESKKLDFTAFELKPPIGQ